MPDAMPNPAPTVAVIGAGGIGRHHANWWHAEGARVVAILGRTPETVRVSANKLKALFGYDGPVFTDLAALLREVRPAIVDVCSPAVCHFAHARLALEHDCQVLCEKPLVFDRALPPARLLGQASELTDLATRRHLRFGLCSQHAVAAATCAELLRSHDPAPLTDVRMELRSPARGRPPDPAQTWIDLGPHLLAAVQTLIADTEPDWSTLRIVTAGHDLDLALTLRPADAPTVAVRLQAGFTTGEPANVRRIALNARAFDLLGETGPDGFFGMRYRTADGIDTLQPDPMRLLIRAFLAGHPPLNARSALANQRMLLRVFDSLGACRT